MGKTHDNAKDGRIAPLAIAPARGGEELPRARFAREVARRRLAHILCDDFAGELEIADLERLGHAELIRHDREAEAVEALVRLGPVLALIDVGFGRIEVELAGGDDAARRKVLRRLRKAFARRDTGPETVVIAFWARGQCGGDVRHRRIEVPAWKEIGHNYSGPVRDALEALVAVSPPPAGRLVVWRGPPGTGKTYALRALSRAWRSWCSVHYVLDPVPLLAGPPQYLIDLLTWEDDDEERWRLIVLEDAGDVLGESGTALAPLLNLTDGLLGQGTRTLVLVTTNEPPSRLHPAVRRPGRCLADVEFGALAADEANAWLRRAGRDERVTAPHTLADLFAVTGGGEDSTPPPVGGKPPFGFARAAAG